LAKHLPWRRWHQIYSDFIGACETTIAEKFTDSMLDEMKILEIPNVYQRYIELP
jgi:hypothetical protein